jgi:hypothetical protein
VNHGYPLPIDKNVKRGAIAIYLLCGIACFVLVFQGIQQFREAWGVEAATETAEARTR